MGAVAWTAHVPLAERAEFASQAAAQSHEKEAERIAEKIAVEDIFAEETAAWLHPQSKVVYAFKGS